MRGIDAAGAYVPSFRLSSEEVADAWGHNDAKGVESKAVPNADEDSLTMAVAAADAALDEWEGSRTDVRSLDFATTTPPLEEEAIAPRIVRALGLPDSVETSDATQSTLAGAQALSEALGSDGPVVVVAADAPSGAPADADHALGAGAAAFVVTDSAAAPVLATGSHSDEATGLRYRTRGSEDVESLGITTYERGVRGESVAAAVASLDEDIEGVAAAAVHQPDGGAPYRLERHLPFGTEEIGEGVVADRIGDAGAATVPLGLLSALDGRDDGEHTVAAFFGSGGGASAFLFERGVRSNVETAVDGGVEIDYPSYLRKRGVVVDGDVAGGGAHVSLPSWRRSIDQRYRLVAGECVDCQALAFPPEGACPDCGSRQGYDPVEMPRQGTVAALSVIGQGGAPPEFTEQQQQSGDFGVAIVTLENESGSVRLPGQLTDADPADASIGDEVRAVLRRIYDQEGLPRYGVKFVPV